MIIRSQNKKVITNLDNVDTIEVHDCQIRYFCGGIETAGLLGEYTTEEKAIKVLDMIQEKYLEYEKWSGGLINQYSSISPFAFIPPKVFQMPQDSEV